MSENPDIGGIVMNIRDVTERKKIEEMREMSRLLEEERLKVKSLADANHELRTPIAIIKGNVDLALMQKGKTSQREALQAINQEITHLSDILSDLNLLTLSDGGSKNKMISEPVDLEALIGQTVKRCTVLAHKKNISMTIGPIPRIAILGNKMYLEKMLVNLVKNSILYGNKDGHTEILAKKSKGFLVVSVIDDGIGISKEDMPHIFERFYRTDTSHTGDGVGLGLSIVKWVAEIHGGKVEVKSIEHKGSTFSVSLPIDTDDGK